MTADPRAPGQAAQAADSPVGWAPDAASTAAPDNRRATPSPPRCRGRLDGARPHRTLDATTGVDGATPAALHQLWDGSLPVESWINQGWTGW